MRINSRILHVWKNENREIKSWKFQRHYLCIGIIKVLYLFIIIIYLHQIIPSCSDLVTLCIDIWVTSEETDCVKLAFATDIANRNLVLTDLQPPPLCRYMKASIIILRNNIKVLCQRPRASLRGSKELGWFMWMLAREKRTMLPLRDACVKPIAPISNKDKNINV